MLVELQRLIDSLNDVREAIEANKLTNCWRLIIVLPAKSSSNELIV
jgi:hypothetical protein